MTEETKVSEIDPSEDESLGGGTDDAAAMAAQEVSGVPMEPAEGAIHRLEGELDDLRDRHARLAAEFDNYRKRIVRERAELSQRAQADVVMKFLDVLDDFERFSADESTSNGVKEAVALVEKKLRKELGSLGLERIEPTGAMFDPSVHEAVSVVPAAKKADRGTVSATFQAGYSLKGILVRPARVQVFSDEG